MTSKRALAIDIGLQRTGLAVSSELGLPIKLLPNLVSNSQKMAVSTLLEKIGELEVKTVVIGIPEERTVQSKTIASRARSLKNALDEALASHNMVVKVILFDESHTSRRASLSLVASGVRKKERKTKLDSASAAILLEDFLASQGD